MRFFETGIWQRFQTRQQTPHRHSSGVLETPLQSRSINKFALVSPGDILSLYSSTDSPNFWKSSPTPQRWSTRRFTPTRLRSGVTKRQVAILVCIILSILVWRHPLSHSTTHVKLDPSSSSPYEILRPEDTLQDENTLDPERWLRDNSNNKYAMTHSSGLWDSIPHLSSRPRAALISLVRNSELDGIVRSMEQLEYRWNRKYQYPWVFINDEPFSDEFKAATRNLTSATCYYETIPKEHWSLPDWIDEGRFMNSLEYLGTIGVGKGWMISYRHMCRWNSGFFYRLPRLLDFDWYWRVEPDVCYFNTI